MQLDDEGIPQLGDAGAMAPSARSRRRHPEGTGLTTAGLWTLWLVCNVVFVAVLWLRAVLASLTLWGTVRTPDMEATTRLYFWLAAGCSLLGSVIIAVAAARSRRYGRLSVAGAAAVVVSFCTALVPIGLAALISYGYTR